MSMTDPIADMLTRIRNGLQVRREYVDVGASRVKRSSPRCSLARATSRTSATSPARTGHPALRIFLKYDDDGAAGDPADRSRLEAGTSCVPRRARDPAGPQRSGHLGPHHVPGHPLGPRGPRPGRGWRDPLRGLVADRAPGKERHVSHRKDSRRDPGRASTVDVDGDDRRRQGPQGRAPAGADRGHHGQGRRRCSSSSSARTTTPQSRALHGLYRALCQNMVEGVTKGFEQASRGRRRLVPGAGRRATSCALQVGYSHPVDRRDPQGSRRHDARRRRRSSCTGIDKQLVGQFAATVRRVQPPEPYKGKGVRYLGEEIVRKAGKSFVGGEK